MITGFLTPLFNEKSVYPTSLKQDIVEKHNAEPMFDVQVGLAGYKNLETEKMIEGVYKMTDTQMKIMKDYAQRKDWDFCMGVVLGTDRMQHTMWRFHDEKHRKHPGETPYKNTLKEYYKYIDKHIGELKEILGDDVVFIVASDHGFDRMDGRFNLNDWLIKEGYLVLKETPTEPTKLRFDNVDWSKTRVYAVGAYFGRLYFNKISRDPDNGILQEGEVEPLQNELITKLTAIQSDRGEELQTPTYKPQDIYEGPYAKNGPDLYVYFDNLRWGVNNDVGNEGMYSQKTTKGSDDAGHAPTGMFCVSHPSFRKNYCTDMTVLDVLPTIFKVMGLHVPSDFRGRILVD